MIISHSNEGITLTLMFFFFFFLIRLFALLRREREAGWGLIRAPKIPGLADASNCNILQLQGLHGHHLGGFGPA